MSDTASARSSWAARSRRTGPPASGRALHGATDEAPERWKRRWAERQRSAARERAARRAAAGDR